MSAKPNNGYQPGILAFCCNWCGYAGADAAGASKYEYPTSIKIVRVMCTGRVDPSMIISAFLKDFDGVMLVGCHIGDCHYVSGNINAVEEIKKMKNIFKTLGIEDERLIFAEVSGGEGPLFAKVANDFHNKLISLGPLKRGKFDAEKR
ncbi:MAG: hydrogenase iron-sulfur subunit [Myxococcota bacterium]